MAMNYVQESRKLHENQVFNMDQGGGGGIIRKERQAELPILHGKLCIDLFYNPTEYH